MGLLHPLTAGIFSCQGSVGMSPSCGSLCPPIPVADSLCERGRMLFPLALVHWGGLWLL